MAFSNIFPLAFFIYKKFTKYALLKYIKLLLNYAS